jgi:hypothetical protein
MTPTLLATGKMEPRLPARARESGNRVVVRGRAARRGVLAAPIAAWLVRKITAGLLGVAVGGIIILTNVRTLFEALDVQSRLREPVYAGVAVVWFVSIAVVVRRHRRTGSQ